MSLVRLVSQWALVFGFGLSFVMSVVSVVVSALPGQPDGRADVMYAVATGASVSSRTLAVILSYCANSAATPAPLHVCPEQPLQR